MKGKWVIYLGLALGLVMVFSAAHADQQSGWYVGLKGGTSTADVDHGELDVVLPDVFAEFYEWFSPVVAGASSLEDNDTAWSLFGGYRFNEFLAVEAGYTSLGTTRYLAGGTYILYGSGVPGPVGIGDATFVIDSETTGFNAGLVANLPLGASFDLHANVGLLFSDTEITGSASTHTGLSFYESQSNLSGSDQDVFYGAGVGWHLSENWSLSLDYQFYKDVGSEDTGEADIDAVTLAAVFHF